MSKRRFFIIGKGSGTVMRHLTVNVGGGHGSLLVNGELVTLNENNTYEGDFPDGTQIELETVATTGYNFEGWYDDSEDLWPGGWNYDNPTTFTLDADYSLELHFVEMFNVVVQTSLDPSYGYITVNGEPGNFSGEVSDGSQLELQGVGDNQTGDGRRVRFSSWTDNNGGHYYDNPITYTIDSDITINCNFDIDHFTEFIVDPTKYSIVRGGQTMAQTFTDAFISGSCEQYECVCETGYQFDGWLVDGVLDSNTNNPRNFCDNGADRTVEPSVSAVVVNRHISINVDNGNGTLSINGTQVQLDANNTWEDDIADGTQITMEITTDSDHNMIAWHDTVGNITAWQSDSGLCYDNPATLTVSDDYTIGTQIDTYHNVTVVVDPSKYTLIVGGTTYTSNYTGRDVSGNCDNFEIIPQTGYQFNSWGSAWNNNTTNPDYWCYYNDAVITPDVTATTPTQPNDEIWYTSSDGQVVTPYRADFGTGITVTSNTYADGKGIIKLSGNATTIGNNAFNSCNKLNTIEIPDSVTSIGNYTFYMCTGLRNVTIGNGVTSINQNAFNTCMNLLSVTIPDSVTTIGNAAFANCTSLSSITIPDSVATIGNGAFGYCTWLRNVTIGNGVTSMDQSVFTSCKHLESIVVDSNNSIYDSRNNCNAIIETSTNKLLYGCKNTVIPNSVTDIGWDAFGSNNELTTITIPNSVTSIRGYAFSGCTGLTSVTCEATTPPTLGVNAFSNTNNCPIYVPAASVTAYQGASGWSDYSSRIQAIQP